ncbi:MAG: PIN domain-containing protein [Candidatus Bathyarchaeia archaeon]|nr:PIN domain-containing protein [Candidatus Brockarchaeota archaeon]
MRSRQSRLRILLDTSFILPSLGIDVGREAVECLKKLAEAGAEILYSRFSILEGLWVIAKLTGGVVDDAFNTGLRSIMESGRYVEVKEDPLVFSEALRLYALGHRDMVDNILYASSVHFDLKLLTLDNELKKFVLEKKLKDTFLTPSQLTF